MSARRLTALAAALALAACNNNSAPAAGLNLSEPNAVAVYRGFTPLHPELHYYVAIASSATNELDLVDGIDGKEVPGPFPLRGLVFPVPDRPTRLAAADLGDGGADLLVVATAGSASLQVVRSWASDGAIVGQVNLPGDVMALAPLDPVTAGTARIAAVLAGERVALIELPRADPVALGTIDPARARVTFNASPLGFQPIALARSPGHPNQVWVASRGDLGGGVHGVAAIDLTTSSVSAVLDARAPTRLVGAARVRERPAGVTSDALDAALLASVPAIPEVDRVYAVLDEPDCGLGAPIPCGLVALDPVTGTLVVDPVTDASLHASYRAPIPIPVPLGIAIGLPPKAPPLDDPRFAGTVMRVVTTLSTKATSAIAGVTSTDGSVWFVDLSRWEVPGLQLVQSSMAVTAAASQPPPQVPAVPANQWLVLDPLGGGSAIPRTSTTPLAQAVTVTPGYTPTDTWTIVKEGLLPKLSSRPAEAGVEGGVLWLALQTPGGVGNVVRVWDPTAGIRQGDLVVLEPIGLGTCGTFEAKVSGFDPLPPTSAWPGGRLLLSARDASTPAWTRCLDELIAGGGTSAAVRLVASVRAADYVLIRGTGTAAVPVDRPRLGVPFRLTWSDESAGSCNLPPAVPWPETGAPTAPCGDACRQRCQEIARARLARRLSYVSEDCLATDQVAGGCQRALNDAAAPRWSPWPDPLGPAIGFTLDLQAGVAVTAHRDLALTITTSDGRAPARSVPTVAPGTDARGIIPVDTSPWNPTNGTRFYVVYPAGEVMSCGASDSSGLWEIR